MYIDIWPSSSITKISFANFNTNSADIEKVLFDKFGKAHPIVCSSARSCLNLLLDYLGCSRNSLVKVPAYASHCILESISRTATPVHYASNECVDLSLVYHQWGIPQNFAPQNSSAIIEDSCDSVYERIDSLMLLKSNYEIWSLPKILGCSSGGVIWCKFKEDAATIKEYRDHRTVASTLQWALRMLGRKSRLAMRYWSGVESLSGKLPSVALNEILNSICLYDDIVKKRNCRINLVEEVLNINISEKLQGRLPSCLPFVVNNNQYITHDEKELNIGFRHYEKINSEGISELARVLPLPVHQDMPISVLEKNLMLLKNAILYV